MEEEERERLLALQEAEEARKEKHRKMEEEREKMRQSVREKVSSNLISGEIELKESLALWLTWNLSTIVQYQKEG